jgi:hypothetical protein
MSLFTRQPTSRTPQNLKKDFEELKKSEATLWQLKDSHITRGQIPQVLEQMKSEVRRLVSVLGDIQERKKYHYGHISHNAGENAKKYLQDLDDLEKHISHMITILSNVTSMKEEGIESALNHGKEGENISKTAQILIRCIQKCENDFDKVEIPESYYWDWSNDISDFFNNYSKNKESCVLELDKILNARIIQNELFDKSIFSGWGILYEGKGSSKFKLVKTLDPKINKLMTGDLKINNLFLFEDNYNQITGEGVIELDLAQISCLKNSIAENEFIKDIFWREIFSNNEDLMKKYFTAYKNYYGNSKGFNFYSLNQGRFPKSQWRPLMVGAFDSYLSAEKYLSYSDRHVCFLFLKGPSGG